MASSGVTSCTADGKHPGGRVLPGAEPGQGVDAGGARP